MPATNVRLRAAQQARRTSAYVHAVREPGVPVPLHHDDDLKKPKQEEECNIPITPKPRDATFWLALVFIVAPIYLTTFVCWGYSLYTSHRLLARYLYPEITHTPLAYWEIALYAYCTFEAVFSIYYQSLAAYARSYRSHVPLRDIHELQQIYTRVLQTGLAAAVHPAERPRPQSPAEPIRTLAYDDPRAADFRNNFRHWFHGAAWKDLTRPALKTWLGWSVFDRPFDTLDHVQKLVIEEATSLLEKRAGSQLPETPPEGKEHIKPVMLTWDPVNVWSRPAMVYVVGDLLNRASKWYLEWKHGLKVREFQGIEFLVRNPSRTSEDNRAEPIVFMHGIGLGLAQYTYSLISILNAIPESTPFMIPLQPNISHSIFHPFHLAPLSRERWVDGLKDIFEMYGWADEGVTMISHSKGSLVHARMLKAYPEVIRRSCLMDPVCFCLWEGDLAWNFVYRRPSNAVELVMKYFAATEPGIALAVQRHFDWADNSLWFEEIPHARDPYYAAFFLGGKDSIINAHRVRRYLTNHGISEGQSLRWNPRGRHGQPLMTGAGLEQLLQWLRIPGPRKQDLSDSSDEEDDDEAVVARHVLQNGPSLLIA